MYTYVPCACNVLRRPKDPIDSTIAVIADGQERPDMAFETKPGSYGRSVYSLNKEPSLQSQNILHKKYIRINY